MSNSPEREIAYQDRLFRVERVPIAGRELYSFVRRIGSVTILPVVASVSGPQALLIDNKRRHHGLSTASFPSGNAAGGHTHPEAPRDTVLRELREETGYGYPESTTPNISLLAVRPVSSTIFYDRHFAVVRYPYYLGGEGNNASETITPRLTPLEVCLDELLQLRNDRIYAEVNAGFAKAAMELGSLAVLSWLTGDLAVDGAAEVPQSFEPWLTQV